MLKCLRVTDIIGCKRALWYKNAEKTRLKAHPRSLKGQEIHAAISEFLINGTYPKFREYQNRQMFSNFELFYNTVLKPVYSENSLVEKRLYSNTSMPYSGKMDWVNNGIIYDWKIGKQWREKYALQMAGYASLLNSHITIRGAVVVLLGNNRPFVYPIHPKIEEFMREYNDAIAILQLTECPPPEYSELCAFCDYIHHCREEA